MSEFDEVDFIAIESDRDDSVLSEIASRDQELAGPELWRLVVERYGDALDAYARRRCAGLGVPMSFAESAVHEGLVAGMTRDHIEGGALGAAKLVYCVIRRQVINEWRRLRRLARIESGSREDESQWEDADLQDRLVDAGWSPRTPDAERTLESMSVERRQERERRSVELGWTLLPVYAPGDRTQVKRHVDTLKLLVDGLDYGRIASVMCMDAEDAKVRQRLRAWKRRGGLHLRGWVHALVGSQPALDEYDRQSHGFWNVGFVAGNAYRDAEGEG